MANRDLMTRTNQGRTPTRWRDNDFSPSTFQRAMDRLFDDFFRVPEPSKRSEEPRRTGRASTSSRPTAR